MKYGFGFIGTGNMGSALVRAVAKMVPHGDIAVCDKEKEKAELLANEIGCNCVEINELAQNSRYIFLGVKPQIMKNVLADISDILKNRKDRFVLVTMAAGLTIETICRMSRGEYPIIRIMPNIPAGVGEGMILCCSNNAVKPDEMQEFRNSMCKSGLLDFINEDLIDAGCAVSGSGPAFVFMFLEALADGAVECGLPRDKALMYSAQTLIGASKMMLESGQHPGVLKDAVCSPGGTTIAGVKALESEGLRSAAISAIVAAYKKAKELSQKK